MDRGRADSAPELSLVIAHYNRPALITTLLTGLEKQTLSPDRFEVVIVDDGSREDPRPQLSKLPVRFRLTVVRQQNQGAAAARDHGISVAKAPVVVVTDDDMILADRFLEKHLEQHQGPEHVVVLGLMRPDAALASMPLFERFHALMLDRMVDRFRDGERPRGHDLFTGNVSFRREDYLAVGGFDRTLGHSEDAELGIRLEKLGARFVFSEDAYTIHGSDHLDLNKWLRRAKLYGMYDRRIARKHPDYPDADPWRFISLVNPLSRPFLGLSVISPEISGPVARGIMKVVERLDRFPTERLAVHGTTLVFGIEYFRGLREECGSLGTALSDYREYRRKRARKS